MGFPDRQSSAADQAPSRLGTAESPFSPRRECQRLPAAVVAAPEPFARLVDRRLQTSDSNAKKQVTLWLAFDTPEWVTLEVLGELAEVVPLGAGYSRLVLGRKSLSSTTDLNFAIHGYVRGSFRVGAGCTQERGSAPLTFRRPRQRCRAAAQFNHPLELTSPRAGARRSLTQLSR